MPARTAHCTYDVDGYDPTFDSNKVGAPHDRRTVAIAGESNTSYVLRAVASTASVDATVAARAVGGTTSVAVQFGRTLTPPWPAANVTATSYPMAIPHTIEVERAAPPHLPAGGEMHHLISDGTAAAPVEYLGGPADDALPGRHTTWSLPPAAWREYSVQACYEIEWREEHACATYDGGSPSADAEPFYLPDAVTDLRGVDEVGAVRLAWTAPDPRSSRVILDYQINRTSPYGVPRNPIPNKVAGNATAYLVTHLPLQTGSSLRVAAETIHTHAASGVNVTRAAIVNVMPSLDFIAGQIDLVNETRGAPDRGPHISFGHARYGEDVVVTLAWPGYAASRLNCAVDVPVTGSDYTQAVEPDAERPDHLGKFRANLTLAGLAGRLAIVECTGGAPTATPGRLVRYPLRDSYTVETDPLAASIPFLEWVALFRAGDWGTAPNLGAFDLVTLIVVIISMIGFQRASPGMGVIFGIMVLGVAAYFELVVLETVILGTLALLAMIAIIITRRGRHEVLE